MLRTVLLFTLFCVTSIAGATQADGAQEQSSATYTKLPLKAFASLPDVSQVQLSPDGTKVVSLNRIDADDILGTAISVYTLATKDKKIILFADNEKFRIKWAKWANKDKLLVSAIYPALRYNTPTTETRLLIVDVKSGETRSAISKSIFRRNEFVPQIQDRIVSFLPQDPNHFLLQADQKKAIAPGVYKVSLNKDRLKTVMKPKTNIDQWIADRQGNVRIGLELDDATWEVKHKFRKKDSWQTLWKFESFSEEAVFPLGFDHNPEILYVSALHEGRDAIFKVNLRDESLKKTLVHANDEYDVDGTLVYSALNKKVIGLKTSTDGYVLWEPSYMALVNGIDRALKNTDNTLVSLSNDEQKYVVLATSDTDAGAYYVGDRKTGRLGAIAVRYNKLDPKNMAPKTWLKYKARDGLEIEAALTLPLSHKDGQSHPTIIFPHGGPISFDGDGFDYWTQFFANRGYAVLQMNFRGSAGYGFDFMEAGLGKWGLQMQDDVEDAARWMIDHGYTDKNKLCIVGASYGGYAALMATVKSPKLYKCAVSFAGVTDIADLVRSQRRYSNYDVVKKQIGDDYKQLRKRSPLYNIETIETPILLIHGTKDRSVSVKHSNRMYKALKKRDKKVEYLELQDGNHHLSNEERRIAAFEAMERFLAAYLD